MGELGLQWTCSWKMANARFPLSEKVSPSPTWATFFWAAR
jgi:hypothetical protein